jgi:hypothetical protein
MREIRYFAYPLVISFLLTSVLFSQPPQAYAYGRQAYSADVDGDGLPNIVEQTGWFSAAGGPYVTNYLDMDSDDDGLTDGQEKLYDTNPLDDHSPGIYIEYEEYFKTREYFSWQRYGSKYIGKRSAVVRRGTTVSVGGPPDASIQISKSISSLTKLTAVRNPCSGRWDIQLPSTGTVGAYTVTLQDGGWSKSLNLYVIFQLPAGQSSAFVNDFVTNDDPNNTRDDRSITFGDGTPKEYTGSEPGYQIPEGESIYHGSGWAFMNWQYRNFVFEDHVIQAINGKSNTWDAANALGERVDEVTCFGYPRVLYDSWCVLNPSSCGPEYNNQNQCSNIADLLTAFIRAAGIPARPVFTDWPGDGSFDHSTEVWTRRPSGGSYDWYVMRGYDGGEGSCPDSYYTGGYVPLRNTSGWYATDYLQGVYAGGENWANIDCVDNPACDDFRMASWDLDRTAMTAKIVKKGWWETRFVDYWDWPSEPEVIGSPPGDWPDPPPSLRVAETGKSLDSVVQFGQVVTDYGVDLDGDGRFDQLVFRIEVNAVQAGDYWIRGALGGNFTLPMGSDIFDAVAHVYLAEGHSVVELPFDGKEIYMLKADGPYSLDALWATDIENPTKSDFAERELAFVEPAYQTAPYQYSDFGVGGATLSGDYNHYTTDTDADGHADTLVVQTSLNIEQPGTYTVQGVLYGGDDRTGSLDVEHGEMLAEATWTGTGPHVTLQFDGLDNTTGPYTLQYLHVRNAADQVTDGIVQPYPLGDLPEFSAKPISLGVQAAVPSDIGPAFIITGGYAATPLDTNGNGKFDQLVISTAVDVAAEEAGQAYRLEGWLVDQHDDLVAWAISDPKVLSQGTHSLSLAFDGRIINEHGVDGPFTLVALKALPGNTYTVLNQVDVAYTTPAYNYDEFEEPITSTVITSVFRDNMENGSGQWSADYPWTLSNDTWSSYSHAWKANDSGSQTGSLSLSLAMPEYTTWFLTFKTCYVMQSANDAGYLEASTDDVNWTQVATYTNSTVRWSTQFLTVHSSKENQTLQLRFKAQSQNGLRWYVDDVSVSSQHIRYLYLPLILK